MDINIYVYLRCFFSNFGIGQEYSSRESSGRFKKPLITPSPEKSVLKYQVIQSTVPFFLEDLNDKIPRSDILTER